LVEAICSQSTANHTSRISKNDFEVKREAISADTAPQLTGSQLDDCTPRNSPRATQFDVTEGSGVHEFVDCGSGKVQKLGALSDGQQPIRDKLLTLDVFPVELIGVVHFNLPRFRLAPAPKILRLSPQRPHVRTSQRAASARSHPQQSMQCSSTPARGWLWARAASRCQRRFQRGGRSRLGISASGSKPSGGSVFRRLRRVSPQGMVRAGILEPEGCLGVMGHPFEQARPLGSIQDHAEGY